MAEKGDIKLIGTPASPYVIRVRLLLTLKSIDYELIEENLACKSELLLTMNPIYKKIPVLFHANEPPICESLVIMEYLDEIRPHVHPIFPSNPTDRANNRFWAFYIDSMISPMMKELLLTKEKERKEELKNHIIEASKMLEEAFVKLSNGKAFFGGDDMGYLDLVFGCLLGWTKFSGKVFGFNVIDEVRTPRLAGWEKSMWSHEVVKRVIPSDEILMSFLKMVLVNRPPLRCF